MQHTWAVNRSAFLLTLLLAGWAAAGCSKHVGDGCSTNIDCAQDGTRICDLSQPGGYCTVDGCDDTSCPGSICVRFFDQRYSTRFCPNADPGTAGECPVNEPCIDVCRVDELCVVCGPDPSQPNPINCCVQSASERRYCAATCGDDGDCRGGYVCRESYTLGSLALLSDPAASKTAKFCAPVEK
jgi:hypothetical protein